MLPRAGPYWLASKEKPLLYSNVGYCDLQDSQAQVEINPIYDHSRAFAKHLALTGIDYVQRYQLRIHRLSLLGVVIAVFSS